MKVIMQIEDGEFSITTTVQEVLQDTARLLFSKLIDHSLENQLYMVPSASNALMVTITTDPSVIAIEMIIGDGPRANKWYDKSLTLYPYGVDLKREYEIRDTGQKCFRHVLSLIPNQTKIMEK